MLTLVVALFASPSAVAAAPSSCENPVALNGAMDWGASRWWDTQNATMFICASGLQVELSGSVLHFSLTEGDGGADFGLELESAELGVRLDCWGDRTGALCEGDGVRGGVWADVTLQFQKPPGCSGAF